MKIEYQVTEVKEYNKQPYWTAVKITSFKFMTRKFVTDREDLYKYDQITRKTNRFNSEAEALEAIKNDKDEDEYYRSGKAVGKQYITQ